MKTLVTGASGFLGSRLMELGKEEMTGSFHRNRVEGKNFIPMDITDREATLKVVRNLKPDAVIHSAAMTKVDDCELRKDLASRVNAEGTRNLIKACEGVCRRFVYVSTDFVFDGKRGNYKERDETKPVNFYGKTKLEGERLTEGSGLDSLIVRISTPYGWFSGRENFATWVISELSAGNGIRCPDDWITSPTYIDDCAETILSLAGSKIDGIIHVAGERISRYDFACKIADRFGMDCGLVRRVKLSELGLMARRPNDSSLCTDKLRGIGFKITDTGRGLEEMGKRKNKFK